MACKNSGVGVMHKYLSIYRHGVASLGDSGQMASTPNIISCTEYRRFWVSWDSVAIRYGTGWTVGENVVTQLTDSPMKQITHLAVTTYDDAEAFFMFA